MQWEDKGETRSREGLCGGRRGRGVDRQDFVADE